MLFHLLSVSITKSMMFSLPFNKILKDVLSVSINTLKMILLRVTMVCVLLISLWKIKLLLELRRCLLVFLCSVLKLKLKLNVLTLCDMADLHSSTKFVLKNGTNALEFKSRRSMLAYRKRFCQLFPDVDSSSLNMFKVIVYQIKY